MVAGGEFYAVGAVRLELATDFRAPQYPHQPPHAMVMDRCGGTRPPYKAHHREALEGVAVQQVLPIDAGFGVRERVRQPGVLREELREKVEAIAEEPVEADLIVEGVPGSDPAAEAARARLRDKAQAAKDAFRS